MGMWGEGKQKVNNKLYLMHSTITLALVRPQVGNVLSILDVLELFALEFWLYYLSWAEI